MLFYSSGHLYYSAAVSWLAAAVLLASPAAGWALYRRLPLIALGADEWRWLLAVTDWALAATLMSTVLWNFLGYSFAPAERPELHALRSASAVLASVGLLSLTVQLLPRPVLAATTALYVGLSLNVSCWWASAMLHLQRSGLAPLLPESLRRALLEYRLLDWLRDDSWSKAFYRLRQLLPVCFVADEDVPMALAELPPDLRARVEAVGMKGELPDRVRELVEPWAKGPDYLSVKPLSTLVAMPTLRGLAHPNGGGSGNEDGGGARRDGPAAPVAAPPALHAASAPEWLLLYALRQHCTSAVRERARSALLGIGAPSGRTAATSLASAAAAALVLSRLAAATTPARRRQLLQLLRRLLPYALACYALAAPSGSRRRAGAPRTPRQPTAGR